MACLLWLGFAHQGLAQSDWSDLLTPYGRILDLNGRNIVELPPQEMTEDVEIILLGNNQLRNLPLDLARRCPHVKAIFLSNNLLDEIPPVLNEFRNLQELYLDGNQIVRFDGRLRQLDRLRVLSIRGNRLTTDGLELSGLAFLEALLVDDNDLSAIPRDISMCPQLLHLSARNNRIDEVHHNLAACEFLTELDLSGNTRLARLPVALEHLPYLRMIDVADTDIGEVPNWANRMPALEYFILQANPDD